MLLPLYYTLNKTQCKWHVHDLWEERGRGSILFGMIFPGFLSWSSFCNSKGIASFNLHTFRVVLEKLLLKLKMSPGHSCMVLIRGLRDRVKGDCGLGEMDSKSLMWESPFEGCIEVLSLSPSYWSMFEG